MPKAKQQLPVAIIEAYNGYTPPYYVRKSMEKLLRTVPLKYLAGLERFVLTNFSAESRKARVGKTTRAGKTIRRNQVIAFYCRASRNNPPYVELFVDKILAGRTWYWTLPFLRELFLGFTLFHELGHHVHATRRPEFREKEIVADEWRDKFLIHFIRKQYWYVVPFLFVGAHLIRLVTSGPGDNKEA